MKSSTQPSIKSELQALYQNNAWLNVSHPADVVTFSLYKICSPWTQSVKMGFFRAKTKFSSKPTWIPATWMTHC